MLILGSQLAYMFSDIHHSLPSKLLRTTKESNSFIKVCLPAFPFLLAGSIITSVVDDYELQTVQEYMYHIRSNAEISVRDLLRDVAKRAGTTHLSATDFLDDGSPVWPFQALTR